jgi:hypothetical protein
MNRSTDNQVSDGNRQSWRTLQAGGHHALAQARVSDQLSDDPTGCPHTPPDADGQHGQVGRSPAHYDRPLAWLRDEGAAGPDQPP